MYVCVPSCPRSLSFTALAQPLAPHTGTPAATTSAPRSSLPARTISKAKAIAQQLNIATTTGAEEIKWRNKAIKNKHKKRREADERAHHQSLSNDESRAAKAEEVG